MARVCSIITRLNVGGAARQVVALTKYFSDSHLIYGSLAEGEMLLPEAENLSVGQITRIESMSRPIRPFADNQALRRITAKLRRLRPEIVHTHTSKAGLLGRIAARRAGVPIIMHTYHGHVFQGYYSRPVSRVFLAIERAIARRTDALIAVSTSQFLELTNRYRIATPGSFHVVPLGMELSRYENLPPRGKLRNELGVPDDVFLAGFVGRLEPVKQPEKFLEIIARLDNVHGVIVGGGTLEKAIGKKADEPGLKDRLHFAGWRSDLPEVYADLDAVVLTSANEGTPVALIEAAACGLPVVAFNVGGVRDVVNEKSGFLVCAGDVSAAVDATRRLSESPELCGSMGLSGKEFVTGRYNFKRLVNDLSRLYDKRHASSVMRQASYY